MLPPGAAAGRRPALILGTMRDKDFATICKILAPLAGKILLPPIGSARTADPALLAACCREAAPGTLVVPCENLASAFAGAAAEKFIVVTGSIHFIGEAMEFLGLVPPSSERDLNDYNPKPGKLSPL
jgi:folylpolyglutamate synthase/dihydropteroate synthase